jgi:hypothetical protein
MGSTIVNHLLDNIILMGLWTIKEKERAIALCDGGELLNARKAQRKCMGWLGVT